MPIPECKIRETTRHTIVYRNNREDIHDGRRHRRTARKKMPMQPAVAGVDEGVEVDGDDGDEVVLDEATR